MLLVICGSSVALNMRAAVDATKASMTTEDPSTPKSNYSSPP